MTRKLILHCVRRSVMGTRIIQTTRNKGGEITRRYLSVLLVLAMMVSLAVMGSGPPTAEAEAGLVTQDLTTGLTPAALVTQLLGGGVSVDNVTFVGADCAAGSFSGGPGIIGFETGIILSSGDIAGVIGPNTDTAWGWDNGLAGDADLDLLIPGYFTYDATVLEFDFVPSTSVFAFDYVFGSEEYNEFVSSSFNDVFGFFVNGVNQALIPGTDNTSVSINNVNNGSNPAYYRNNDFQDGSAPIDTQLDGLTVVLTATAAVNAGVTNHIKMAIADAGDGIYDSDVFIRAGSVSAATDDFGYACKDSNQPGGPTYEWVDITTTGTEILPDSDDQYVEQIPVGFFFNFYGNDYSEVSVTNNGIVMAGTGDYDNEPIGSSGIDNFIAPFWDDIVTWDTAGAVYYQTIGTAPNRIFVVEWYDNQHYYSSTSGITFEVILYEGSNNIKFQYQDVDFGDEYYNGGAEATVGIEGPDGQGLQYSYNEQVLSPGMAILFTFPAFSGTNMRLSKAAPVSMDQGNTMTYSLYYNNFGCTAADNVTLQDTLPSNVDFVSASDGGVYDNDTREVTWDIGAVPKFPYWLGSRTVVVTIPDSVEVGTVIVNTASIATDTLETRYDDNDASASTIVTGSNLPAGVGIEGIIGGGDVPSVYFGDPTTFTYECADATGVDISIHIDDGGADITGSMTGGPPTWSFTTTFYPRHGQATVTYTVTGGSCLSPSFNIYIDPAGYVYDLDTLGRISGATVWLQRPDGEGGWENVPTAQATMDPDTNPLTTGADGQYQWDVLAGTYRVHVEAPGYLPADSMSVNIPPPVTDLHVGLAHLPIPTPTLASPATGTITGDNTVDLDWSDVTVGSGATPVQYQVQVDNNDDFSSPSYDSGWILVSNATTTALPDSTYYWRARAGDSLTPTPNMSEWSTVLQFRIDITPPTTPVVTDDGVGTTDGTQLHAAWISTDDETGIAEYQYAIGTTAGATDVVDWTSAATAAEITHTGLSLTPGTTYYISAKASNGAGLWSEVGSSDGIVCDTTAPSTPVVTDDGAYTTNNTRLNAAWSSSDDESGIAEYQYAIGTTAGATDVVDWTSADTAAEITHIGLSLTKGTTYYVSVKASNGAGLWSEVGSSDGIIPRAAGLAVWTWIVIAIAAVLGAGTLAYFVLRRRLTPRA